MKPLEFVGSSLDDLKEFPAEARRAVAKFAESVYVLHVFQKKTQKTTREDIELARTRYRQIGDRG